MMACRAFGPSLLSVCLVVDIYFCLCVACCILWSACSKRLLFSSVKSFESQQTNSSKSLVFSRMYRLGLVPGWCVNIFIFILKTRLSQ